jgi:hypothetical protein
MGSWEMSVCDSSRIPTRPRLCLSIGRSRLISAPADPCALPSAQECAPLITSTRVNPPGDCRSPAFPSVSAGQGGQSWNPEGRMNRSIPTSPAVTPQRECRRPRVGQKPRRELGLLISSSAAGTRRSSAGAAASPPALKPTGLPGLTRGHPVPSAWENELR